MQAIQCCISDVELMGILETAFFAMAAGLVHHSIPLKSLWMQVKSTLERLQSVVSAADSELLQTLLLSQVAEEAIRVLSVNSQASVCHQHQGL